MQSLRAQLLFGAALGSAAVLLASGAIIYTLVARSLWSEFDRALAAKARTLATMVEFDEAGLESDLVDAPPPEFADVENAEYYQIWAADESVFVRSPSLRSSNLDFAPIQRESPEISETHLPDGRPGRIARVVATPRHEPPYRAAALAAPVAVAVARDSSSLNSTLARVRVLMFAVGLFAVAISSLMLAWLVQRSLRPVSRLSREISEIGDHELSRRVSRDGVVRELSSVVDRLNALLARLECAFRREQRFTGDVAHELRTPLAGLRAKIELALSRERTTQFYNAIMRDCLGTTLQMQGIVENLLHLARADAGQLILHRERVMLPALLREGWIMLEPRAVANGLNVEWLITPPGLVQSDADALRVIVRNLLDNAVTYTTPSGRVCVSVAPYEQTIRLIIRNTSELPPEDAAHALERFWRADQSRQTGNDVRCGLGLPLCKALMERLDGTLAVAVNNGIFEVAVTLPAARIDVDSPAHRGNNSPALAGETS
ncbi:MAG: sensor histidine kinase N-terminal domain-containing protein [Phycisphaerales bacterium]|nr:sensor histidine kinase N-terminal domain-containing protein [Phycisphaerales bacterium]